MKSRPSPSSLIWSWILRQRGFVHCLTTDPVSRRHVCLCVCSVATLLMSWHTIIASVAGVPLWYIPSATVTHVPIVVILRSVGESWFIDGTSIWDGWGWNESTCRWCGGYCHVGWLGILCVAPSAPTIVASTSTSSSIRLLRVWLILLLWCILHRWMDICWSCHGRSKCHRTYGCRGCRMGVKCHRRHGCRCCLGQVGQGLLGCLKFHT
jgi:hypothetical protein